MTSAASKLIEHKPSFKADSDKNLNSGCLGVNPALKKMILFAIQNLQYLDFL